MPEQEREVKVVKGDNRGLSSGEEGTRGYILEGQETKVSLEQILRVSRSLQSRSPSRECSKEIQL